MSEDIKQRAEALGWDYWHRDKDKPRSKVSQKGWPIWADFALCPNAPPRDGSLHFFMDDYPETAELLLSCYEAKARGLQVFMDEGGDMDSKPRGQKPGQYLIVRIGD